MTGGETTLRSWREHPGDAEATITTLAGVNTADWEQGVFEVIHHGGAELLGVRGKVAEHVDHEFPQWGYILVLRVGAASLVQRGMSPCALAVGDIVEFRADRRHRLVQGPRSALIWAPIDSAERMEPEDVRNRFHDLITNPQTRISQTG